MRITSSFMPAYEFQIQATCQQLCVVYFPSAIGSLSPHTSLYCRRKKKKKGKRKRTKEQKEGKNEKKKPTLQ